VVQTPQALSLRIRSGADALLDTLTWSAARGAVDAVRYQPRQLALTLACATSEDGEPAQPPPGWWLAGSQAAPVIVKSTAVVNGFLRAAAAQTAWWLGPTPAAVVRWFADAMAGAADRMGAATLERPLGGRVHPGMLVPHVHRMAVLAIDMRGFSNLTRALNDSMHLVDLIEEYLAVLTLVVERHRGVVFQYTGDGLLALFLPELSGTAPGVMTERLVGTFGPELHEAFDIVHARWRSDWSARGFDGVEIGLGAGMSFGEATMGVMGPPGKKQIGVIGEPVNLAAFLCSQAPAASLLVDVDSFSRAGAQMPPAPVMRLRSKKRHQRIRTLCLHYGDRPQRHSRPGWRSALGALDLRWGWPPIQLA